MVNQETASQREILDEENWLRSARLEDLYRLARLCDISLDEFPVDKKDLCREDMINILQACRENELTDARFRDLMRPANTFDVKNTEEDLKERVNGSRKSLRAEIRPLKVFSRRLTIWAAIVAGVAGILGSFLLNSLLGIRELESSMKDEMETALVELQDATANLGKAEADLTQSTEKVSDLEDRLAASLEKASKSNRDFQKMIIVSNADTGIQMIGKLNARLDRLTSMKVYHLKPLMKELALDIDSGARTLKSLEPLLDENSNVDERQLLASLGKISAAFRDLRLIYDEDDEINMENLREARRKWSLLDSEVSVMETTLRKMIGGTDWSNLPRLKANVYQVQAGLAIQQYRESSDDGGLLQIAQDKCAAAIAHDPSVPMAYLYKGLISSLRISLMRKQEMDPNVRIEAIEEAKDRGVTSYRTAVRILESPAEVKVYAVNGAAYLMVKTSNMYVEAAEHPACSEFKTAYVKAAKNLLASAKQEIKKTQQAAAASDPIVLTTQADIEILSLQFNQPADPDQAYANILDLLGRAVSNGYTGYAGPKKSFFEKRPHFRYLAQFDEDYDNDVCRAVGIQ